MPTTIAGPGDFISQQFAPIYGLTGNPSAGGVSGGGSGAFGLQPQAMSGNDLTQMQRSLTNLLGLTGAQLGGLGQGVLGAGVGTMQGGLQTLQSPIDFWSQILSGSPAATAQALAPTAANIAQITAGATDQASRGMPAGGYRASTLAGLPFQQAAQVGNAALALQPTAASALGQLGGEQATIGSQLGQLGTTLTGQGLQGLDQATQAVLRKMGLNLQEPSPFQDILGSLAVAAPILKGIGGLLSGGGSGSSSNP